LTSFFYNFFKEIYTIVIKFIRCREYKWCICHEEYKWYEMYFSNEISYEINFSTMILIHIILFDRSFYDFINIPYSSHQLLYLFLLPINTYTFILGVPCPKCIQNVFSRQPLSYGHIKWSHNKNRQWSKLNHKTTKLTRLDHIIFYLKIEHIQSTSTLCIC